MITSLGRSWTPPQATTSATRPVSTEGKQKRVTRENAVARSLVSAHG